MSAVLFLYRNILGDPMGWTDGIVWAKRTRRLPTVLSPAEVARVIKALDGQEQLMVRILYGTGLRLLELLRLRVKDVDFDNGSILVRCGKGMKDRITVLPDSVREPLEAHIASVRRLHERDVKRGGGYIELPYALGRKLLGAPRDWPWQWVFPARRQYVDARTSHVSGHAGALLRRRECREVDVLEFEMASVAYHGSMLMRCPRGITRCRAGLRSSRRHCSAGKIPASSSAPALHERSASYGSVDVAVISAARSSEILGRESAPP